MIDFKPLDLSRRAEYDRCLMAGHPRGCEFSFANLFLWGRQSAAFLGGRLALFSQFNRRTVYPFPVGTGELKAAVDAIIADAHDRGIPCRITGLLEPEIRELEALYPGRWRFHCARDSYDYVYAIEDLAELKGRKYQKKRNHLNRFRQAHPHYRVLPLEEATLPLARDMLDRWFADRLAQDSHADLHMEMHAVNRALANLQALQMEGLVLMDGGDVLAVTMGSRLSPDTFDVHFEKARADTDGAYTAINYEFARYIREKYPQIRYLNREDDMGLEGLRTAKLSYHPHHLVEKCWACLLEDGCDY